MIHRPAAAPMLFLSTKPASPHCPCSNPLSHNPSSSSHPTTSQDDFRGQCPPVCFRNWNYVGVGGIHQVSYPFVHRRSYRSPGHQVGEEIERSESGASEVFGLARSTGENRCILVSPFVITIITKTVTNNRHHHYPQPL